MESKANPRKTILPEELRQGLKDGLPLALSIFAYGLVYGILARQAGLSYWETVTMSALVVAGASQFVAVNMISAGASAGQIVLATFLLNLRHLLMGATLAPYLSQVHPWKLAILAHLTNDESYAVTIGRFQRYGGSAAYFLGAGIITFSAWFLSSALAGAVGDFIGDPRRYGLDFAFYGAFIGLLVPQLKDRNTWSAFLVSAMVSLVVSLVLPGKWYIIIAALLASLAGLGIENLQVPQAGEGERT